MWTFMSSTALIAFISRLVDLITYKNFKKPFFTTICMFMFIFKSNPSHSNIIRICFHISVCSSESFMFSRLDLSLNMDKFLYLVFDWDLVFPFFFHMGSWWSQHYLLNSSFFPYWFVIPSLWCIKISYMCTQVCLGALYAVPLIYPYAPLTVLIIILF